MHDGAGGHGDVAMASQHFLLEQISGAAPDATHEGGGKHVARTGGVELLGGHPVDRTVFAAMDELAASRTTSHGQNRTAESEPRDDLSAQVLFAEDRRRNIREHFERTLPGSEAH